MVSTVFRCPKIDMGMPGRLRIILVCGAIWVVKRAKRCKWGIFKPNWYVIAHGFYGGPDVRTCQEGDYFSVVHLDWQAHLGGQTGEIVQIGYFGPNQCAITHDFRGRPGVRACRGPKIDLGIPGRLGIVLVLSLWIGKAIWVVKRMKQCKRDIFKQNRCAIAHGFGGGSGVQVCHWLKIDLGVPARLGIFPVWSLQAKQRKQSIFNPNSCAIAHDFGGGLRFWVCRGPKINLGIPGRAGHHSSVVCLDWRGYLSGQMGEMVQTGCFRAISAKNKLRCVREAGDHSSIVCLGWRGHLGGQTGEEVQMGLFGPNRCTIAHDFDGLARGLGLPWGKNRPGYAKTGDHPKAGNLPVWSVWVGEAIWMVKRANQCKQGIFGQNWCAIAHSFRGGPVGSGRFLGQKSTWACQELGFWACRGPKIDLVLPGRPRINPVWSVLVGGAIWVVKHAKWCKRGIFALNLCAIAQGFRSWPGAQECRGFKINLGIPGRLGIVPMWFVWVGGAIWMVKRAHFRAESVCYSPRFFGGGPGVRACRGLKIDLVYQGGWESPQYVIGAKSDAPLAGWGGPGGYVYQKAYLEFFCSREMLTAVVEKCKAFPFLTYMSLSADLIDMWLLEPWSRKTTMTPHLSHKDDSILQPFQGVLTDAKLKESQRITFQGLFTILHEYFSMEDANLTLIWALNTNRQAETSDYAVRIILHVRINSSCHVSPISHTVDVLLLLQQQQSRVISYAVFELVSSTSTLDISAVPWLEILGLVWLKSMRISKPQLGHLNWTGNF
ncbi:hypothetical protein FXO38_15757 [Capsicum annuum]|nr:hypothetical protein FXO38_15757 [Capsicum annuum]KAF3655099.1 hypothetical protein FXO37_16119 [Capsicum annuum]